jgi:hypothetical protein
MSSQSQLSDLERVKKNPGHLAYVSKQNKEICLEAVKRNGLSLYYVTVKDDEIYRAAIKQNPHALTFIDEQTDEICELAVTEDGMAIQFVKNKTPRLCLLAVKQNGAALRFISKDMWTDEIITEAVKQDPSILQLVENQTEEICLTAIDVNPNSIAYVKNQTGNIIKAALSKGGSSAMQHLIDFRKFNIASIQSIETGEIYIINDLPVVAFVEQQEIKPNEPKKLIYFDDLRKGAKRYITNAVSIQHEIEKYILQRYGKKCLEKALAYHASQESIDNITNDMTFDDGVFFVKHDENNYDMYKKSTTYSKGWFYGKTQNSIIEKIRVYGVIEEE